MVSSGVVGGDLFAVVGDDQQFVAVGQGMASSMDGSSWSEMDGAPTGVWQDIVWTGAEFLAVGSNGELVHSPSGSQWETSLLEVSRTLITVTSNTDGRVIVGGDKGTLLWR